MNHKPGSVANLTVGVGVFFENSRVASKEIYSCETFFPWLPSVLDRPYNRSLCSLPATLDGPPCCCLTLLLMRFAETRLRRVQYCCQYRGGLLPRHFTITRPHHHAARQYAFCCTFCPGRLNGQARVLPGIMPCGARTFLPELIQRMINSRRQPGSSLGSH